jgi:hypothetical protein
MHCHIDTKVVQPETWQAWKDRLLVSIMVVVGTSLLVGLWVIFHLFAQKRIQDVLYTQAEDLESLYLA